MRKVHLRLPVAPVRPPVSTGLILLAVLCLVLPALSSPSAQAQVAGASCPCSIWTDATTPAVPSENDLQAVEVGVKLRSDVDGYIHGLRFYKGSASTGSHLGNLWTATGALLASAAFTAETPSGWQQVTFAAPVPITANTTYIASYHSTGGDYAVTPGYFNTSRTQNGPVRALASGEDGPNGVFRYGPSGFPDQSFNGNNYWVDVVFDTIPSAGTPPVITGVEATAITSTGATISWNTDQPADSQVEYGPATVYGATTVSAAPVTSHSLALSGLTPGTLYHYRVKSKDAAGNPATSADLTFTTAACPCTVWGAVTPPAAIPFDNGAAIELGVQFRPDLDGYITGLRFYKADGDPGVHVGNLWTTAGALLASAVFTAETPSGWQHVIVAPPVPVTAGTTYVASYRSSAGRYVATGGYFTDGVQSGPLRAPATGEVAGGNGVFAVGVGFPTGTYQATNYWVDVVFTNILDTTPPDTTITSGPANPSNGVASTVAFSASEADSTFACSIDGAAFIACTSPVSLSGLAAGAHTFQVRAIDPAGNLDPTPASHTWTVDPTPPVLTLPAPITSEPTSSAGAVVTYAASATDAVSGPATPSCAPASGALFALGTTAVSCAATDAAGNTATGGFTVTVRDSTAPAVSASGVPAGWSATSPVVVTISASDAVGLGSVSYSLDGAPAVAAPASGTAASVAVPVGGDGAHTLSYWATDAAGNASAAATATVRIDTTPPSGTVAIDGGAAYATGVGVRLALAAADATSGVAQMRFSDDGLVWGAWEPYAPSRAYTLPAGDGPKTIQAQFRDAAGNASAPAAATIILDTTAPETRFDGGPAGASPGTGATFAFSSTEAGATFACSLDGAPFAPCASPVSFTALSEGSHTFAVRATDPAGNTDPSPASSTWTVDTTPPAVVITAPVNGGVTNSATPALAAEAGDGAGSGLVSVQFQRSSDGGKTYSDEAPPDASPPYAVTASALADGTYSVRAIATDRAGNQTVSAAVTFTVDTVAPAAPSTPDLIATDDSGGSNTDNITNHNVLTFTGMAEANSTVELFQGTTSLGKATVGGSGAWSFTSGAMADGAYSITARATDRAGNTGPASGALGVTIDTAPPVLSAVQASGLTDRTVVISWASDEAADTTVEYGTTSAYGSLAAGDPALVTGHSRQLTGLLPNTHYHYRVRGQDAAGNTGFSADFAFTTSQDLPPAVVATVAVGDTPRAAAVNPTTGRVYVANEAGNSLSVIDESTNRVVATVPIGALPRGVAVNPGTDRVYATNYNSGSVSVLDGATNTVVATVPVGVGPRAVGVNPTTGRVYVANAGSDSVSVIDASTDRIVATVPVGAEPRGLAVNPTTNRVYVSDYGQGTLWVIDGSTSGVIATVAVGSGPRGVAVNPATNRIYVANELSNTVSVLDGAANAVVATVAVGTAPFDVGVNPTTDTIYVANSGPNTVSVLNGATNAVVATLAVGSDPWGLAVDPLTERVYTANRFSNNVSVIQD
ncbi:MAG TPA: DUF4082 domain-containing protein [Chloroflexota bacterium]|nr:DUF4082 domain-containing protein [Chloroflexota bacterium]